MDKQFYTDNFERLLKEKSDDFKMIPSKRVWHSIYNDLHPSRRWPSVAMSLLLIGALLLTGYLNTNKDKLAADANNQAANPALQAGSDDEIHSTDASLKGNISDPGTASQTNTSNAGNDYPDQQTVPSASNNIALTNRQDLLPGQQAPVVVQMRGQHNHTGNQLRGNNLVNSNGNKYQRQRFQNVSAANTDAVLNLERTNGLRRNTVSNSNSLPANNNTALDGDKATVAMVLNQNTANSLGDPASTQQAAIVSTTGVNTAKPVENIVAAAPVSVNVSEKENKPVEANQVASAKTVAQNKDLKAWMEDYALHNKPVTKKWKGRLSYEFFITPSLTLRNISANSKYNPVMNSGSTVYEAGSSYKPAPGLELGSSLIYDFSRKMRLNAGLQLNYTNYAPRSWETDHPILTTLTLNDLNSGYAYLDPRTTYVSTSGGSKKLNLRNKTYQLSANIGLDFKLLETEKIQWYVGAAVQPSWIIGGRAFLVSSDKRYLVQDNSMLRKFNISGSFETFISYKTGNYNWQIGPNLRYQFMSSFDKKYNEKENLLNAGLKIGVVKKF